MRKKLVAGNWKMHGSRSQAHELMQKICTNPPNVEMAILPPYPYLAELIMQYSDKGMHFGAQDCSAHAQGAYTGEVATSMLKDLGCHYVVVGHSERRQYHAESNEYVALKFAQAQQSGLVPILCVGETLAEREKGVAEKVVSAQIDSVLQQCGIESLTNAMIAYEPVWAIGTGRNATPEQAQEMHAFIRGKITKESAIIAGSLRILYGGSVKSTNARQIFAQPDVDGGLVGGASLIAEEFLAICNAAFSHP